MYSGDRVTVSGPGFSKEKALKKLARELESKAPPGKRLVFGEGYLNAALAIVGECPGANEEIIGHPFVGRAGRLLEVLMGECSFSRKNVWLTNLIKWRLTDAGGFRNRAPLASESKSAARYLLQELRVIRPVVVLALGNAAAGALTGRKLKMKVQQGEWFNTQDGWRVVVTFHPAYLLRQNALMREKLEFMIRHSLKEVKAELRKRG